MDIATELAAFDGKRTDVLENLAGRLSPDAGLVDRLCALAGDDDTNMQSAATWLLKRFQEEGFVLAEPQARVLLGLLGTVASWDAKLHLLQMLPRFDVPVEACAGHLRILMGSGFLEAPNKFVRAWTYNGLAELAERDPTLRAEVAALLTAAERDEAASVRARIRAIVKAKPWVRMAAP